MASFEIIDFHTHPYRFPEQSLCMYEHMVPDTPEVMEREVRSFGVGRICGSVLRKDWAYRELNDSALLLKEKLGDFYVPGFHIHPAHMEESRQTLTMMLERGYCLIGELVPYMHDWAALGWEECNRRLDELLEMVRGKGFVFSFHTMWDWPMEELMAAHPDVTFVAAHPGERESVEKHIARMKKYDNVCLDLSGTGIFRNGCIRHLVNEVGPKRLLFGTDYPICNHEMYIHSVLGERLTDAQNELIFSGNARRILHLEAQG